jgi:signal transduction histidine kinase/ligand-binding sensor domain-containing protein
MAGMQLRAHYVIALAIAIQCSSAAFALDSSLDINQYAHTAWTVRDGFFHGGIQSIAQTPDGFLWLGTEFGLLRFDGVRAVPWTPPGAERLPSANVTRLIAARDGTLWIGTFSGLASWNGARLTRYRELDGKTIWSLLEDRGATVWAGSYEVPTGRLCAIRKGATQCFGQDGSFGQVVLSLFDDGAGNLWAGAANGLWRWGPGPPRRYALLKPTPVEIRDLNSTEDGQILMAVNGGIEELVNGRVQTWSIPGVSRVPSPGRLLPDRNGGLWIGTDRGLIHVHHGRTDLFSKPDGLSGDFILSLFEDREGSVWAATNGGLDRFREFAIPSITVKQGLSNDSVWSVLGATDGTVWLGTRAGLNRWSHGQIASIAREGALAGGIPQSLFQDDHGRIWTFSENGLTAFEAGGFTQTSGISGGQVHAITGDDGGNLWLAHDNALFHLGDRRVVEQIPWKKLGHKGDANALVSGPDQGLWIGFGFQDGGIVHLDKGQVSSSYSVANGLGGGTVSDLRLDRDRTLWAATEGGLSVIKNGRVTTLTSRNGLCDSIFWTMEDGDQGVWLYTPCGLMRVPRSELEAAAADPNRTIQASVFDTSDGVRLHSVPFTGYSPPVTKASDGRLWFVSGEGVGIIDPHHLPFNKLPPPVHIEEVKVDGKVWDASRRWRLPALIRDITIRYTALSFVAPEKVHFRYKLEGQDPDWKEVVNDREAQYTNLKPRNYRFRVIASNNSGVWNTSGDTLEFSVAPAYYQTTGFGASLAAVFVVILWGLYRLRLYQVAREFSAQTGERARIARDLHDTLLQSFQASLIQMQTARNIFPRRPEEGIQTLDNAIGSAEQAIDEGRRTIQDLRATVAPRSNLEYLLTVAAQQLAEAPESNGTRPAFAVTVEGAPRILLPALQDEVYRIGREVLRNAFRHAHARHIEAEIRYDKRSFRLRIRDDGKGIDRHILDEGAKEGHWGLPGIRERAKRIGGRFDIWSETGAGTEIQLTVPASRAYAIPLAQRRFGLFRKKTDAV